MGLTSNEQMIANALQHKGQVSLLTLDQVARRLGSCEKAVEVTRNLVKKGIICSSKYTAARPSIIGPLYASDSESDFSPTKLEYAVRERYRQEGRVKIFSLGPFRRLETINHELGLSEVYIYYAQNFPDWQWIGERQTRTGQPVPDATVISPTGEKVAIDFIGTYRAPKIALLAANFSAKQLEFEFW